MRRGAATGFALCLALALGLACRRDAKVDPCPTRVVVSAPYPGASPAEVETAVVDPVEEALARVQGVGSIAAVAREGAAEVVVELDKGVEAIAVLETIRGAVGDSAHLFPDAVDPPVVFLPAEGMHILVSEVPLSGTDRELLVEVEPAALQRFGITVDDVAAALREGLLELPAGELLLRTAARPVPDINEVTVGTRHGVEIRLADFATVREEPSERAYRGDGRVFVSREHMLTKPDVPPAVDVLGPLQCKSATVVSVTASLPGGTPPEEIDAMARKLATSVAATDPRAVAIAGGGIELIAPVDGDAEAVAARLAQAVANEPGLVLSGVSGVPSAVSVELWHDDADLLHRAAGQVATAARARAGVVVVTPSLSTVPQLDIELDPSAAASVGLAADAVVRTLRAHLEGIEVARLQDGGAQVVVRLKAVGVPVDEVTIRGPDGAEVSLSRVARISRQAGPSLIFHRDRRRAAPIELFGPGTPAAIAPLTKIAEAAGVTASLHAVR